MDIKKRDFLTGAMMAAAAATAARWNVPPQRWKTCCDNWVLHRSV